MKTHPFVIALVAVVLTVGAAGAGVYATLSQSQGAAAVTSGESRPLFATLEPSALKAKAVALYDLRDGRLLYQKEANVPLPLASITKLMTILTILAHTEPGSIVEITKQDVSTEGDWGFYPGQTVRLSDLIRFSLVASSNDAMEAAASSLGPNAIALINESAYNLGLTKSHFYNATGLDQNATKAGAYGSAYDVARLAAAFYRKHADLFEITTKADVRIEGQDKLSATATALPLLSLPGFVAAKTGYTDLAGGNLVAVFDLEPGRSVVGAVLGSTREGRFEDMRVLIEAARAAL